MGFWNLFFSKKQIRDEANKNLSSLFLKVRALVPSSNDKEIRYLSSFAGLLGRVAFSDLHISEEELDKIEKILKRTTTLADNNIKAISKIILETTKNLVGLEDHIFTKEIKNLATREQKEEILTALFLVASSDKKISSQENEEIRIISKGIGLSKSDFISIRTRFKKYLTVLKD